MGVDAHDLGVFEQLADARVRLTGLSENGIGHHPLSVKAAQRQDARLEYGRNAVDIFRRLVRAFRYEDRMAGAIRVRDIVADVVKQKHALADVAVSQAHPAWEARLLGDGHADNSAAGEIFVRQAEERTVRLGIEAGDSVGHAAVLPAANISRV